MGKLLFLLFMILGIVANHSRALANALPKIPKEGGSGFVEMEVDAQKLAAYQSGKPRKEPWNGYWWRDKTGGLAYQWQGANVPSPIEKLDKITGERHEIVDWERRNHTNGSDSGGQCDGYSQASVREPEPKTAITCRGVKFEVGDIKGLLGSIYLGDMSGQRVAHVGLDQVHHQGQAVDAVTMHLVLTNVMGRLGQGMYVDVTKKSGEIYNKPLAGYSMVVKKISATKLQVITKLQIARYDQQPSKSTRPLTTGPVGEDSGKPYLEYELELDNVGKILPGKGKWLNGSENRVPTAFKFPIYPPTRNKYVNPKYTAEMIAIIKELASGRAGSLCAQAVPAVQRPLRTPDNVNLESLRKRP